MLQEMRQKVRAMRQEMSDLQVNLRLKTMKTLKIGWGFLTGIGCDKSFESSLEELPRTNDDRRFSLKMVSEKNKVSIAL